MWNEQADTPELDRMIRIPAQRVRPPEVRGEPTVLATGEMKKLHSEWFIVPGAPDYRVLGAPNIVVVLNALNFYKCLGHSCVEVPRIEVVGSSKVRNLFFLFFVPLLHFPSESRYHSFHSG